MHAQAASALSLTQEQITEPAASSAPPVQQQPKGLAQAASAAAFLPHKMTPAHMDALAAFERYRDFYLEEVTPLSSLLHPWL